MDLAIKFLESIKKKDKVLLIAHNDGDGFCSGTIMYLLLKERGIKPDIRIMPRITSITELKGYDQIIMVDVSPPQLSRDERILIIDHHKREKKPECVFINPAFKTKKVPSCSALCYQVYSKMSGKNNLKWVALLGSYSDRMMETSLPLINLSEEEKRTYLIGGQLDPALQRITKLFLAGYLKSSSSEKIIKLLIESAEKEDPLLPWLEKHGKARELYEVIRKAENETIRVIKNSKVKTWPESRFVYLHIGSQEYNIKRMVIDYFRLKYPGYIVSVSINSEDKVSFSTRSPSLDLTKLIPRALEGIPNAIHGGHSGAYGCSIPKGDREKFVENLKQVISKSF